MTVHLYLISGKLSQLGAYCFLVYLFQLLYMFRQLCAQNQENVLVFFTLYRRLTDLHTRRPLIRFERNECSIDTISSPDDGHIIARNMYRSWNKYTKKWCEPSWVHLKESPHIAYLFL